MKIFLLFLLLFPVIASAQETWSFDMKDAKVGDVIDGKLVETKKYIPKPVTAGEYIKQAGSDYLIGVGMTIAGAAFAVSNMNSKNGDNSRLVAGGVLGLGGFVMTIIGHTKLVKAGVVLDKERNISLVPSSTGTGLALKF